MTQWLNLSLRILLSLPSATLPGNIFLQGYKMAAADANFIALPNNVQDLPHPYPCLSLSILLFYQDGKFFLKFCSYLPPGGLHFHPTGQEGAHRFHQTNCKGQRLVRTGHDSSCQWGEREQACWEVTAFAIVFFVLISDYKGHM